MTIDYRNLGHEKLLPDLDDGVGMRTAAGREVPQTLLLNYTGAGDGIDQCRGAVPRSRLQPQSTMRLCTVHLLAKGDRPAVISYKGEGKSAKLLRWRAR
ncbi:hypothetical protein [Streptomyces sp. NPDC059003]|uniref:hypothetical protein n=1 Tax=Streptomyces sp. NPDC059003 TaxID=3346691 RepID=UPI003681F804